MYQPSQPPPQYSTLPPAAAAAAAPPPQQQPDPLQQPTMQQSATMAMMPAMTAGSAQRWRISARHTLFKVAFSGLLLAVVLFIVGFSAPGWANKSGLWMSCSYRCFSNVGRGSASYVDAVRAMESLALVCFLVCVGVELYQDLKMPPPRDNKAVEILAAVAALFGLIGITVFAAKTNYRLISHDYSYGYTYTFYHRVTLQWGFALATSGCLLALLCAALMAYSRVKHKAHTELSIATAAGRSLPFPTAPSAPGMLPMQPMVGTSPAFTGYQPFMVPCPSPYPYFYPCPHPYPLPSTPLTAQPFAAPSSAGLQAPWPAPESSVSGPAQSPPQSGGVADGCSLARPVQSQAPAFFVMTQGRPVPVYNQMPPTTIETSPGPATTAAADGD